MLGHRLNFINAVRHLTDSSPKFYRGLKSPQFFLRLLTSCHLCITVILNCSSLYLTSKSTKSWRLLCFPNSIQFSPLISDNEDGLFEVLFKVKCKQRICPNNCSTKGLVWSSDWQFTQRIQRFDSTQYEIQFNFSHYCLAWHDVIVQISKVFKVQTYYKTLIRVFWKVMMLEQSTGRGVRAARWRKMRSMKPKWRVLVIATFSSFCL